MSDIGVKGWTCEKPVDEKLEKLCLPTTTKDLVPGYDFKTSTGVGTRYTLPPHKNFEFKPVHQEKVNESKSYKEIQHQYRTTYQEINGRFNYPIDPIGLANKTKGTKFQFVKETEHFLKQREVDRNIRPISNYQKDYKPFHFESNIVGNVTDTGDRILCEIKAVAKDVQTKANNISPSMLLYLDNYLSSQKVDFPFISQERRKFFITPPEKFESKEEKNASRIFEEGLFRRRHLNRTVPKFVARVPHTGIIPETKLYKNLWDSNYLKPKTIDFDMVQLRVSKYDAMKIPGMYKTEYSHYGSKISPNEIV